ncbi:molybdenum ABC transporter ATP-binding protein [Rhodoferax sp. PAMC 29310]|uniref:molybdenum ABC transporter ATP-binding protein n=1 Tax=Rhodoferax sp. PAMC 29310 TaxID=2822760 RepID=UPI001B34138F|nr:molybdenum ABC transporter ATP-binding protein [Rhodoferax sp. PAMC 29310]
MSATGHSDVIRLKAALSRRAFSLDIDLALPAKGITALFGASGSGKTTCLRVLAGLEPQATGSVSVHGVTWQDSAQRLFRPVHKRALGYVFQEASLFEHLQVEDNLKFGFKRTPRQDQQHRWDHLLDLLGITYLLSRWPHELSGGERQRVAIARALATSPQLLLMDEPLAALDAARKSEILPYLARLPGELGIPIIYVSHSIDEVARLADHLVLLDAGRVTANGPTDEVLTRLDCTLAHGDTAGAVITVQVTGHDTSDHLSTTRFPGGLLTIPMQSKEIGQRLRIRVQARDVSLTLTEQTGTSILNRIKATVMALSPDSPGQTMVALDAGGVTLLARVTLRSARLLDLSPGKSVVAQIKGVAILN